MQISEVFLAQSIERNLLKTIEELGELQSELIKYITKAEDTTDFDLGKVTSEMADVVLCVNLLMQQFGIENAVNDLIPIKMAKGVLYVQKHGFRKNLNFQ